MKRRSAALLAAGVWSWGTVHPNSPLFGRVLARLPTRERTVALTFDDGPNPDATPRILDTLAEWGVTATFFVLGRHAERWPALVQRTAEEGHALGNHGFWHRKLHWRSPGYVRRDLALGTAAIRSAAGVHPRWFRAPHGYRSPWVSRIARGFGQRTVGWTLGVRDSDRPGTALISGRVLRRVSPGTILLLHDGDGYDPAGDRMQTAKALPAILRGLRERGYGFATLPE